MKYRFLFFIVVIQNSLLFSQAKSEPSTYAVVVGISQYENKGIGRLEYAHKDAEVFFRLPEI